MTSEMTLLEGLVADRAVALDTILARVVHSATVALDADRGTLFLVDRAQDSLVSHVGDLHDVQEIRVAIGEGVAGWVAAHKEAVRTPGGSHDAVISRRVDASTGYETRSLLAAPILGEDGEVVAVIEVLNHRDGPFGERHETRLIALAESISKLLAASSLGAQLLGSSQPLSYRYNGIVGDAPAMNAVYDRTARAAASDATVLVRGESGTGKQLVAQAIHDNSARADKPFFTVDLSALPDELASRELFGHVRGAYTGADQADAGRVRGADGGTLFLDEVGDASPAVQRILLRLLQERSFFPVGSSTPVKVDVRFIFATHRDLEEMVETGAFREDLYYRLRVVEIETPPLRRRGEADLERLIDHFLYAVSREHKRPVPSLTAKARAALHAHPWPGNVRELRNTIERALVLADDPIGPEVLSLRTRKTRARDDVFEMGRATLAEVETAYARWVVECCGGNRSAAARSLDIGRATLRRKLDGEDVL